MQTKPILFTTQLERAIGDKLSQDFHAVWPGYHRWFQLSEHPVYDQEGRHQISLHMPELLHTYDKLCDSLSADKHVAAFLSLYNPPSFPTGCSQMAWQHNNVNRLIRNYDFPASLSERKLLFTNWNGTRVMAMSDCIWGVLDSINEHGLAVSLAYGGNVTRGKGFAITLLLRYVLEFCSTVKDASEALSRLPVHMPYNVTLIDRQRNVCTIEVCPGRSARLYSHAFATNHQHEGHADNLDAVSDSSIREQYIATRMGNNKTSEIDALAMFLNPPLYRHAKDWQGWGTLYTASYDVNEGSVALVWPNRQVIKQTFSHFVETSAFINAPSFT